MPLTAAPDPLASPARAGQRHCPRGAAWWLMGALFALLLALAALRPLALPDEGRYGEVGRWMAVSGDWLAPRLNGLPFFHKPPLLYWLEAVSVTLFGATPWALRLVPALHAGLMLVALFLAARAFGAWGRDAGGAAEGERLARRAALMFGSSPAFLLGGQYINHDMMVAAWISVAIWCFAAAFLSGEATLNESPRAGAPGFGMGCEAQSAAIPRGIASICNEADRPKPGCASREGLVQRCPRPHAGWALAGFAACALGVLSKGLIGLALPGLVLFIWLLWTRQFGKVWRLPWLRGLLLFAVLTVPWFVLVERRFPGALAYLFGVQQFTRYVGSGFNNVWPWWFYLPCIALLLFPWVFFAVYQGVAQARSSARPAAPAPNQPVARPVLSLCWIWIAAILLFFSIPQSKLLGYILPVMPPLALLAAAGWGRWFHHRRAAGAWLAGLAVLIPVVALVVSVMADRYLPHLSARSSKNIARVLACAAAPDDPVYAVGGFPYDLPFYAGMGRPLIAVQDWALLRATAGDTWERELFEAGDFAPAVAARVMQSPPAALEAARTTPHAWLVTNQNADALENQGFRLLAHDLRWALYASPATPLPPESPEAAEQPGLPGCQHGRRQPRQ